MSSRSPHRHPNERHDHELTELIAHNDALREHLARQPTIDETKDVPDTAGYSKKPGTVFIDRHLARAAPEIDGQPYSVWRQALVDHEWLEKGLIDILGYTYLGAHEFASLYEDQTCRRLKMRPFRYNKALKPFIKRDEVERITVPPRDLDCTPYKPPDQDDADRRIMARFRELKVADAMEGRDG